MWNSWEIKAVAVLRLFTSEFANRRALAVPGQRLRQPAIDLVQAMELDHARLVAFRNAPGGLTVQT